MVWLFPEHESRQSKKTIRYMAHDGLKKVCTFNEDSGGGDDGVFKDDWQRIAKQL